MSKFTPIRGSLKTEKTSKKTGKAPIIFRFTISGNPVKIPTGFHATKDEWDFIKQEPKNPRLRKIIQDKKSEIENHLYAKIDAKIKISKQTVDDFLNGKNNDIKLENQSFHDHYLQYIERGKERGWRDKTIKTYQSSQRVFQEFRHNVRIFDISLKLLEDYETYLRKKGRKDGGIATEQKRLKSVVADLKRHDFPISNSYQNYTIRVKKTKKDYLEEDEVFKLEDLVETFERSSGKRQALQMFLFGCYTGFRISDILELRWSEVDFKKQEIKKSQVKTDDSVAVIMTPAAAKVIAEFYKTKKDGSLFVFPKTYKENTYRQYTKKIVESAGITKKIGFHTARRTFATLQLEDGEDIYTISQLLGHTDIKTTQRYLNFSEKSLKKHKEKGRNFLSRKNKTKK
ncbi:MAG: site-specific integrase [Bacteroidales bacterium]|nr:site-specific integrase [Bacteroidales bacterium]